MHVVTARVTLSATQGRQGEHDAKPGRKSRVASGSPKESEDLGMETIKGKPELVRNPARPAPACPTAALPAQREPGREEMGFRLGRLSLRAPCLPDPRLLGEGATRCSQTASQPVWASGPG